MMLGGLGQRVEVPQDEGHVGVAVFRLLGDAFHDHGGQSGGDARAILLNGCGRGSGVNLHGPNLFDFFAFVGFAEGEHFVAADSECVDVGAVVGGAVDEGFGARRRRCRRCWIAF